MSYELELGNKNRKRKIARAPEEIGNIPPRGKSVAKGGNDPYI